MIDGRSALGVIAARGGSKGLPGKNLRPLAGKPLIVHTIAAALAARHLDRVVLSSDDPAIMEVAREAGCEVPFRRPDHLATDEAGSREVLAHVCETLPRHDFIVLLQPTSPLRVPQDIDAALSLCVRRGAHSCASVTAAGRPPEWTFSMEGDGTLAPRLSWQAMGARRQDLAPAFALNGAVFVVAWEQVAAGKGLVTPGTIGYEMPPERSVDIDTELDLRIAECLLNHKGAA